VSDDARRVLTEEERARIQAARRNGDTCGRCGRTLGEGETIWVTRIAVRGEYGGVTHWRAPVGVECIAPTARAATAGAEPERCAGCGRGIYEAMLSPGPRPRRVLCSQRCRIRYDRARAKEARGS
jgi:hypothetical protein